MQPSSRLQHLSEIADDPNTFKVFPMSLSKLLKLSDRVEQFAANDKGIRTCNGCSKKAALTQRCGKCSLVWYCNRVRGRTETPFFQRKANIALQGLPENGLDRDGSQGRLQSSEEKS
jgi:hypothetical protein